MRATLALFVLMPFQRRGLDEHRPRLSQRGWRMFSITRSNTTDSSQGRLKKVEHSFGIYRPADRAAGIQVLEFTPVQAIGTGSRSFRSSPTFSCGRGLPCSPGVRGALNR